MGLSRIGTRCVVSVAPDATVADVARLMDECSVGSVVVARGEEPVGILTDRDLVIRVLRPGRDPAAIAAEEVMSTPLATVREGDDPLQAASRMRERQVRRLPILDPEGRLAGIICLDDLIHHLSRTHHEMSEAIAAFPVPYEGG